MELNKIEPKSNEYLQAAEDFKISNTDGMEGGREFIRECKLFEAEIHSSCDPIVEGAHKTHKAAVAQRNAFLAPILKAKNLVSNEMSIYQREEKRKRDEETRKIQGRMRKEAEEKALAEAIKLEAEGEKEQAEIVIEKPVAPPAIMHVPQEKIDGVSILKNWKFTIEDESQIPADFLKPDETKIGQFVRMMKSKAVIPGITIYCEEKVSVR